MAEAESVHLRRSMQQLFRKFGALASDSTPCGKPLPMAHAHALMLLLRDGGATQQTLCRSLGIDKSNVARLCAKMVEAGHVEQSPSEADGRSRVVALTAKGRRLAEEVDVASKARFRSLLDAIPKARRDAVLSALDTLVEAMNGLAAATDEARAS
jgi:DNA-binding MarR family transcriptional regulator